MVDPGRSRQPPEDEWRCAVAALRKGCTRKQSGLRQEWNMTRMSFGSYFYDAEMMDAKAFASNFPRQFRGKNMYTLLMYLD
jgi:hypothetical protein